MIGLRMFPVVFMCICCIRSAIIVRPAIDTKLNKLVYKLTSKTLRRQDDDYRICGIDSLEDDYYGCVDPDKLHSDPGLDAPSSTVKVFYIKEDQVSSVVTKRQQSRNTLTESEPSSSTTTTEKHPSSPLNTFSKIDKTKIINKLNVGTTPKESSSDEVSVDNNNKHSDQVAQQYETKQISAVVTLRGIVPLNNKKCTLVLSSLLTTTKTPKDDYTTLDLWMKDTSILLQFVPTDVSYYLPDGVVLPTSKTKKIPDTMPPVRIGEEYKSEEQNSFEIFTPTSTTSPATTVSTTPYEIEFIGDALVY